MMNKNTDSRTVGAESLINVDEITFCCDIKFADLKLRKCELCGQMNTR